MERVRLARQILGVTLEVLSRESGYAVSTIGNAETGRTSASPDLVEKVAKALGVRQDWVQTGAEPMFSGESRGFRKWLASAIATTRTEIQMLRGEADLAAKEADRLAYLLAAQEKLYCTLPGADLTETYRIGNDGRVMVTLPELIARLKRVTAGRGKKKELAIELGVPMPRVSEWLAGRREPGGGITLLLLHWVEQQEAQQKGPGDASTPPEPKAQSERQIREEKPIKPSQ